MFCSVDSEAKSWLLHTDHNCYVTSKVIPATFRTTITARNRVTAMHLVVQKYVHSSLPACAKNAANCSHVPVLMVGCSLINSNHALSNMALSDLDFQYLREMLHGSWKWLIKIGTIFYPNILKFSLKIQNLIVTPHSSLWYLSIAISSRIPAPAGFNEESLRVWGHKVNTGQDHAASPAWAHEKFVAEVGLQLLLNEKGLVAKGH